MQGYTDVSLGFKQSYVICLLNRVFYRCYSVRERQRFRNTLLFLTFDYGGYVYAIIYFIFLCISLIDINRDKVGFVPLFVCVVCTVHTARTAAVLSAYCCTVCVDVIENIIRLGNTFRVLIWPKVHTQCNASDTGQCA